MNYALLQAIAITAVTIPALVMAWATVYRPLSFASFLSQAFPRRKPLGKFPPPLYHPTRAWRIAFVVLGNAGFAYMLYGVMVQVLAWMPYDWRDEDGSWMAKSMAMTLAAVAFIPFMAWATTLANKVRRHEEQLLEEKKPRAEVQPAATEFIQKLVLQETCENIADMLEGLADMESSHLTTEEVLLKAVENIREMGNNAR